MESTRVKDLVCGMEIDKESAPASCEHEGKTYYFCCSSCKEKFMENPEKYLSGQPSEGHHH